MVDANTVAIFVIYLNRRKTRYTAIVVANMSNGVKNPNENIMAKESMLPLAAMYCSARPRFLFVEVLTHSAITYPSPTNVNIEKYGDPNPKDLRTTSPIPPVTPRQILIPAARERSFLETS